MRRVIEEVITSLTRNQVVHHGLVGSNPTLSARKIQPASGFAVCRLFLYTYTAKKHLPTIPLNVRCIVPLKEFVPLYKALYYSDRRVRVLCAEGKIPGAYQEGRG